MGIERFFNSIAKNNLLKTNQGIVLGLETKLNCDLLHIDFNSIVYTIATVLDDELQHLLYAILLGSSHVQTVDVINIAKKLNFDLTDATPDTYKFFFTSEKVDQIALERIKDYMLFMVTKLIDSNQVKKIYVAIDGVPQMSKIVEQKRRRYMGRIVSGLKQKLREKYIDEDPSLPSIRKQFELYKVGHDRSKITTGTSFMDNVASLLSSDDLTEKIKSLCPLLTQYIVSTHNIPGEGEKKIIEDIVANKTKGTYVVFSPDADVIILTIIAQSMLFLNDVTTDFNVLRFNQQSIEYDTINISKLIDNIFTYVQKNVMDKSSINKTNVALDVSLLFTLFGNDFLPKIESIDARNDVTTLMNIYCAMINKTKKIKQLIYKDNDDTKYKMNYDNLINIIEQLVTIEPELLSETYLSGTYKNYRYLKRVFGSDKIYHKIKMYVTESSKIFKFIEENVKFNPNEMGLKKYIKGCLMAKMIKVSDEVLLYYVKLEGGFRADDLDVKDLDKLYWKCATVMANAVKEKHLTGSFRLRFSLQPQDSTASSDYHLGNIYDNLPHPLMEITKYDLKSYELERKMGSWEGLLNASDYSMGMINVGRVYERFTDRNRYTLSECPFKKGTKEYYENAFKIDLDVENDKLNDIIKEYLKGIMWVFEFYFNKNDQSENLNHVPIWFYPYHKAPLLTQIGKYISGSKMLEDLHASLDSSEFIRPRETYMNKLEHYIYVSPYKPSSTDTLSRTEIPRKSAIPDEYIEFRNDPRNSKMFPKLESIIEQIWKPTPDTPRIDTIIDCRRIPFLNKCHLHCVESITFDEYMSAIRPLRKNIAEIIPAKQFNKLWMAGLEINLDDAVFLKHYFKSAYTQTRNIENKKYYKILKKLYI